MTYINESKNELDNELVGKRKELEAEKCESATYEALFATQKDLSANVKTLGETSQALHSSKANLTEQNSES